MQAIEDQLIEEDELAEREAIEEALREQERIRAMNRGGRFKMMVWLAVFLAINSVIMAWIYTMKVCICIHIQDGQEDVSVVNLTQTCNRMTRHLDRARP